MKKVDEKLTEIYVTIMCTLNNFVKKENGDTNFISMIIIIGIVVVLAGIFLKFGQKALGLVQDKVENFISTLH